MKTALICGISGQDGAWLAKLLLSKGYNVVGTSRDAQMSGFYDLKTSSGNPEKAHRVLGWKAEVGFDELISKLVESEKTLDTSKLLL